MPKTSVTGGSTNAANGAAIRKQLVFPDQDSTFDGDVRITGGLTVVGTSTVGPAPSTEIAYAQITADQAFTVDALNIDLVSGLAVTVPDLAVPVYVHALISAKHSATSAVVNAVLCKTSPAPSTILDALAMGFACCTTIGNQANCAVVARLAAHSPCTVQLYAAGTAGTMTVLGQTYAPSKIWAVTA
jgi:hypothetical protein